MIRISKIECVLEKVNVAGIPQTKRHCEDYDSDPEAYNSGGKSFDFKENIYRSVKDDLLTNQHNKCCYCETKFRPSAHGRGDVEHYRPKGSVEGEPQHPGYYWLVYDWDNLFVSCLECNRTQKKAKFPLEKSSQRARSHHDDKDAEQPLLIHPSSDNPREHIRFKKESPEPITKIGLTTIKCLGLRRSKLEEDRRKVLKELERCCDIINCLEKETEIRRKRLVSEARKTIASATLPEAEYSSMAKDLLACAE